MPERLRAAAVGYALVDRKIRVPPEALRTIGYADPDDPSTVVQRAGGSLPTTMAAYERYSGHPTRLFYGVGDDPRGKLFSSETGAALGPPQVVEDRTGFYTVTLNEQTGEPLHEVTIFGAALQVKVPPEERNESNGLVVSNVNTLGHPSVYEQTTALLEQLDRRKGVFAFRLSGAHNVLASPEEARKVVGSLPVAPDIVFGNTAEAENLLGHDEYEQAVRQILPSSRVLILTRGSKEIIIRFEDMVSRLPIVSTEKVIDVTGAGDHLMGVTLGQLMQLEPRLWTLAEVERAVTIGAIAASKVIQTMDSRLSREELRAIRKIYGSS
jgi:sugar/nucleoside kinase (ribokinase family)